MFVIDASIVVKWYCVEEGTDKALWIRDQYARGAIKISLPDLVILELANAIRYKKNSSAEDVEDVLNNFVRLGLDIVVPTIELVKKATRLAFRHKITVYDAVYPVLAEDLDYGFITADEKLYEKIQGLPFVRLLKKLRLKEV
jgi:predicted nucleic acid-binding protein